MKSIYFIGGSVVILIIAALFLTSASKKDDKKQITDDNEINFRNIGSKELESMMTNKDFKLINVHVPYAGDIEGTDLSIPYDRIEDIIDLPKDEKIVLYCRSGSMSKAAAEKLVEMGYANVYDLRDGMNGWKLAGNKLAYDRA